MRRSESKPWKVTGCPRLQHPDALVVLVVVSFCGCVLVVLQCSQIFALGGLTAGEVVAALRLPLCYAVAALAVVTTIAAAVFVGFGQLQPLVGN
jgi:hypothetical protein